MIARICQQCGQHFSIPAWRANQGRGKFCSRLCANRYLNSYLGEKHKGVPRPEDVRRKISESNKGNLISLEGRKNMSNAHKGQKHSVEQNQKMSIRMSGPNNPFYNKRHTTQSRMAMSASHKKTWENPKYRERGIKIAKVLWQNPSLVAKMLSARCIKPTKPERELETILSKYFPQFKYNGDGSLGITLGGQIPDFVNIDGRKDLIEVFGDYYHSPEVIGDAWRRSELGKIMIYNSLGWRCLVIWEHELKELTEDEIVLKIKNFSRRKYVHTANL